MRTTSERKPGRNIERALAPEYAEFAKLLKAEYDTGSTNETSKQRLIAVRQFCEFLAYGTEPRQRRNPDPPRP